MLQYPQAEPDFSVALSTSLVLFGFDGTDLQILLARSTREPHSGALFLPSRYLNTGDELMLSARKMFEQLFGYDDPTMIEQLQAFGKVFRHPGGRVINIAHYALVRKEDFMASNWDQHDMQWVPFRQVPDLAFDHNEIVEYAKERLKRRVKRRPVGFRLLPDEFTLGQLQNLTKRPWARPLTNEISAKSCSRPPCSSTSKRKPTGRHPASTRAHSSSPSTRTSTRR